MVKSPPVLLIRKLPELFVNVGAVTVDENVADVPVIVLRNVAAPANDRAAVRPNFASVAVLEEAIGVIGED